MGIKLLTVGLMLWMVACQPTEKSVLPLASQDAGGEQMISMEVSKNSFSPNKFTLRKGVPVKWVINAIELDECNEAIIVPQLGLDIKLKPGVQVIEFTPTESGEIPWSCWMGMIPGVFIVNDDVTQP